MSSLAAGRVVLGCYRFATRLAGPLVRQHLASRARRGREDPARLPERLGEPSLARPSGSLVWLHAASIGESLSALPLIQRLRDGWPGVTLLVTTGTYTSARLMIERLPEGVIHQYAPVDLEPAVQRFLGHWRPALGLLLESELWPSLLHHARDIGCALAVVNGRMSPSSYSSWRRARPVIHALLDPFELVLAQSPEDEAHFKKLGAASVLCLGNLKFAAPPLEADPLQLTALEAACADRPLWLAASTHEGEELIVGEVHRRLSEERPGLLTLLAPRHPDRGAAIAEELSAFGLRVARRSVGQAIDAESDIYLADTIGELGLWYRLAEVVFVGGSLVDKGGQNPLEPAKLGCAVLSGRHTTNFARVTREMVAGSAMRTVADVDSLAESVAALLDDASSRGVLIEAARDYAEAESGVLDRVVEALAPLLDRAAARAL